MLVLQETRTRCQWCWAKPIGCLPWVVRCTGRRIGTSPTAVSTVLVNGVGISGVATASLTYATKTAQKGTTLYFACTVTGTTGTAVSNLYIITVA